MAFDWKATLGAVAPWIAGALGGPAAGLAVKALCDATGMAPSLENAQKSAELSAAGKLTGDQFLALKQAEAGFQLKMQEMGFKALTDLEEIAFKDRDSARQREIMVRDHTPAIGFYLITAGFFGLLTMMLFHVIPESNKPVLDVMVGSLGTAWISCVGYFFGTSAGSKAKDMLLYNSTPVSK